ncbi:MAG: ATP-binding protein [Acidobacteria bacterium]|nr:MAG: ATP-binding protein [Acidobacteriota bacterium]
MQDFEKLGAFYLGRPYDLQTKQPKEGLLLYDSKDLVTHAVCVGMTGSGKTGLCIDLLEEAAIDGIPAIIIDPKGDLSNLMLTFPNLAPQDFEPWVNAEDAQKKGLSPADYAKQQSELWTKGLSDWGQEGDRIKRLRDAADFRIFTPGSNAGIPVSILKSFDAPPPIIREDNELLGERINTTTTSLLGLLGIEADPIRSREHILISNILNLDWSAGRNLDIAGLIQKIQAPPMTKIGVMDLDSFFPAKDRFELAMSLNNLLASPSFASWMEGESLDIQQILYTSNGKPRHAIFSIAHLGDAERMFFVSLLLNQVLGWMRTQSGTTSLRAILYMDEIFGYFPPVANPPSKLPLLTLVKQGRAFGLGVVLVTQNPVDLDYKGLANAGTWFIGRLQTERDKARVLEGLEGIAAGTGQKFDRQAMEQLLAGLSNRIFLLNNTHDDGPEVFETRWAMSYLRGPLTRSQIKTLMDPIKGQPSPVFSAATAPALTPPPAANTTRPILPPEVSQYFIPVRSSSSGATLSYQPMLLGEVEVRYSNAKKIELSENLTLLTSINDGLVNVDWATALSPELPVEDLEAEPEANAQFAGLPSAAGKSKNYESWKKDLANWIYRSRRMELLESPRLKIASNPGESERDFRVRLQQVAREQRDQALDQLKQKLAPKIQALMEKRRRAEQAVERESEQAKGQKLQTAISFGTTILSSFIGRKTVSVGKSMKESQDVGRAEDNVAAIDQKLAELDADFKGETEQLDRLFDPTTEELGKVSLKPTKTNIAVKFLTLVWAPYWHDAQGNAKPAWE